ncbi:polysaccharide deacetylase family protein [Methanogenium marinum]|uniref:Polysaccharide deacetylase family protein n=1 Tax=Methanogenium marinum TaxID=348610 RepID=A0A9Q4PY62_9EURY|nr:polysaccharide deacetylase family protein [Methanogenium marinum]MDE4907287.1 polysaccharide deacetylase family protein [Methanogenium marinum]
MSNQVTVIMYHFVRELPYTRFPAIKGLLVSQFKNQLDYLSKYYQFVTINDCLEGIYHNRSLPKNSALLTFDDAYIDHYTEVFPILDERNIQGVFFPPAKAIEEKKVLGVNKIHFLLASMDINCLIQELYLCIDKYRDQFSLNTNEYYYNKLACESRYDTKEVIFVKRLLQNELDEQARNLIIGELFAKHVSADEVAFSRELYMNIDQLRCMVRNGMYIGSHGYDHYWLDKLPREKQESEIDLSLKFLTKIGVNIDEWIMCYPYGSYNDSLIDILKEKNCKIAFTTRVDIAMLNRSNALSLERLDTNDFPKESNISPNIWTRKVI